MARLATERLFTLIDGAAPAAPSRRQLPVTVTIRQSCGCR
jgi:DNA-binding LacI/PurR family transcriptional regulator